MLNGLSPTEAKALREVFNPTYEGSFTLQCPILDESMGRTLKRLKGSSGSVIDFVEKTWLSTHYKILDIARPLIQLWGSLPPTDPHLQHVESALRLWGVAFRDVTMNRRKNILRQTAPDFLNLLSDPAMFSNREMSRLFGVHFLNAMAKEADEENKIAKIGRSGGHSQSSRRHFNKYARGGGATHQKPSAGPSSSGNGRGTGSNSQRASGSVYSVFSTVISSPYPPIGGRLSQFAHAWRSISSDPFILNIIAKGVSLDFLSLPSQSTRPTNCKMSSEMERACDAEIFELCVKRAILPIPESSGKFFSSIFLVPKKTGGYRPIINLKNLNSHIRFEHFKMEGMDSVRHLIHRGDWMVKLDLKDAYLSVPICLDHQPFLCFRWRDNCYQFSCLAFGLSPAPRLFTKLLKPVVSALRRTGIRLVIYLDDIIVMNESREGVISDVTAAINLLISLGFLINWEKSVLLPSQSLEFLGLVIDSVALSLALPSDKVLSILALCRRSLLKGVVSLHDLSSLIGSFSWAIPTIPFAQAHYRHLQRLYIYHSKSFNYDLSRYVSLSSEARDDICWWIDNLSASNGLCFLKQDPDLVIYSDASLQGWGFACDGVCSRGPWAGSDRLRHINELELLAAFYALNVAIR
jgi:Reverse transcriptase (RNA-dependent DNA polymerase)